MAGEYMSPQFPDLSQMFGARSVMPAMLGMERFQQAMKSQQQNMDLGQQLFQQNQVMNPLMAQHQGLQNKEIEAQIPGTRARSTLDLNKVLKDNQLMRPEVDAQLAEYAAKTEMSKLKQDHAHIERMMNDPNSSPEERQQWKVMYEHSGEILKKKMELEERRTTALAVAQQQGTNQMAVTNANNDAGRWERGAGAKYNLSVTQHLNTLKKATEKINFLKTQIQLEDDPNKKAMLIQMHNDLVPNANAELAASRGQPQAGGVNITDMTQGSIPTNPATNVPSIGGGGARSVNGPSQSEQDWIKRAMQANPGMSEEQIIEQGKKIGKIK